MVNGPPRSEVNTKGELGLLVALEPAQGAQLIAGDGMRCSVSRVLTRRTCKCHAGQIDLVPAEIDQFETRKRWR